MWWSCSAFSLVNEVGKGEMNLISLKLSNNFFWTLRFLIFLQLTLPTNRRKIHCRLEGICLFGVSFCHFLWLVAPCLICIFHGLPQIRKDSGTNRGKFFYLVTICGKDGCQEIDVHVCSILISSPPQTCVICVATKRKLPLFSFLFTVLKAPWNIQVRFPWCLKRYRSTDRKK